MVFKIVFKDARIGNLPESNIQSFAFFSNIYKINNIAELNVVDFSKVAFNCIKIGSKVDIQFCDSDGNLKYTVPMAVLLFTKNPGPQIPDLFKITLISDWYFNDSISTETHSGTVSQIVSQIISKHFKSVNFINTESDDLVRYRYQLSERYQEFMRRLLKYGMVKETPLFLFSDNKGYLNLSSEYELRKIEPKIFIVPKLLDQVNQHFDIEKTCIKLLMETYSFQSENKNFLSSITSKFNTTLFKSPNTFLSEKQYLGTTKGNAHSESDYPYRVDYYGWNIAPTDALAISVNKSYSDLNSTYTLTASFTGFTVDYLNVGDIVWVLLPYEPTETSSTGAKINCGEGQYMIQEVKFFYQKDILQTFVKMVQVAY